MDILVAEGKFGNHIQTDHHLSVCLQHAPFFNVYIVP